MNSMKCFILHLPLFIFFLAGSARADGGDVLDRIVRLPGMKGTVYALLGKVSEQSGYRGKSRSSPAICLSMIVRSSITTQW